MQERELPDVFRDKQIGKQEWNGKLSQEEIQEDLQGDKDLLAKSNETTPENLSKELAAKGRQYNKLMRGLSSFVDNYMFGA